MTKLMFKGCDTWGPCQYSIPVPIAKTVEISLPNCCWVPCLGLLAPLYLGAEQMSMAPIDTKKHEEALLVLENQAAAQAIQTWVTQAATQDIDVISP